MQVVSMTACNLHTFMSNEALANSLPPYAVEKPRLAAKLAVQGMVRACDSLRCRKKPT